MFGIFATLPILDFKQLGVGLAAAILIDATVVRNRYLPKWLHRLPTPAHEPAIALAAA